MIFRHIERLQRRNSIRQSMHSVRSMASVNGGFSDLSYRRKGPMVSLIKIYYQLVKALIKVLFKICYYN